MPIRVKSTFYNRSSYEGHVSSVVYHLFSKYRVGTLQPVYVGGLHTRGGVHTQRDLMPYHRVMVGSSKIDRAIKCP